MPSTAVIITIALIVAGIAYLYFAARRLKNMPDVPENLNIVTLDSSNYQHQLKNGIALVDFWASWCMPCKMMAPILNEVAAEIDGKAKICKVDVQQYQDVSAKFSVRNIPTLILFKNGKEINRFVGVKTKDFLLKEIKKVQ
ncbi:MAG: thioredoxin [Bacteroidales bacterium]